MHRVAGPPALRTGARGFEGQSRLKLRSLDQLVSWTCEDHHSVMDGRVGLQNCYCMVQRNTRVMGLDTQQDLVASWDLPGASKCRLSILGNFQEISLSRVRNMIY